MALNNLKIEEIVKYVRNGAKKAIVISAIPLTFGGFITLVSEEETSSDLECDLTRQEIETERRKHHPIEYYVGAFGRYIAYHLTPQNPQRDERCFEDGHYVGRWGSGFPG